MQELITLSESAATAATETHNAGSDALLGLGVFGLGLTIVFIGLVSLIFITWLYPKIVKALIPSEEAKAQKEAKKAERLLDKRDAANKPDKKETLAVSPAAAEKLTDEEEVSDPALVAAIAAAIATTLGTSTNGIVIKSLRRTRPSLPAWGRSSRIEQISNGL